jgi:hypothetical protein
MQKEQRHSEICLGLRARKLSKVYASKENDRTLKRKAMIFLEFVYMNQCKVVLGKYVGIEIHIISSISLCETLTGQESMLETISDFQSDLTQLHYFLFRNKLIN